MYTIPRYTLKTEVGDKPESRSGTIPFNWSHSLRQASDSKWQSSSLEQAGRDGGTMFTVYDSNTYGGYQFSASNLEEVKQKLVAYGMRRNIILLEDGKVFQTWVKADFRSIREIKKIPGYIGWFPIACPKWDTHRGEYTKFAKVPVAIFADRRVTKPHRETVVVDGCSYVIEVIDGYRNVLIEDGTWLGEFSAQREGNSWYEVIHTVRKPTPVGYISPERKSYPDDTNKEGAKYATSEKGAIRLIAKLANELKSY